MNRMQDVVASLNLAIEGTVLAGFHKKRAELKGRRSRSGDFFRGTYEDAAPLSGYAFHWGGRTEMQFNTAFEDGGFFRYGLAFSLESSRSFPDPVAVLQPKIIRFNAAVDNFPVLEELRMWWFENGQRSPDGDVGPIPDALIKPGVFVFVGERVKVGPEGISPAVIARATSVMASLLPIYEHVESADLQPQMGSRKAGSRASTPEKSEYVARLSYNSQRWWRPTRAEEVHESGDTYRNEQGFGHEDWLLRNEWLLDGWRYGFVQGVNKSRKKLLEEGKPFDLRLFTMPHSGDRRAIAAIRDVECLTDELAMAAVAAYERLGWLDEMRDEVRAAGGRAEALGHTEYAPYILNLRYRLDNLSWLDATTPLPADDPIHHIKRYSLCRVDGAMDGAVPAWRGRTGNTSLGSTSERRRFSNGGWVTYSPEHVRMQVVLLERLKAMYPGDVVVCEQDFVDVMVRTPDEILLFEVKSDLHPLSVVRQALGQVLEYAFHPRRRHDLPLRLVIVGRRPLEGDDLAYFEHLRQQFNLPVAYWDVAI